MTEKPERNGIPEELAPDEDAKNRSIIEAILTASNTPVTTSKLIELVGGKTGAKEMRQYIDVLNEVYVQTGRAFRISEVAGGFQFSIHHEFAPWIRRHLQEKPARLSQAALEVLSIVAFKQPITKAEVEHIRGVSSDGVLRHLMEKALVRIAGRSESVGRPLLYGTARDFLKFFGLKTLADLPKVREVEDLLREDTQGNDAGDPHTEEQGADTGETSTQTAGAESTSTVENGSHVQQDVVEAPDTAASEEGDTEPGTSEQISGESGTRIEESV